MGGGATKLLDSSHQSGLGLNFSGESPTVQFKFWMNTEKACGYTTLIISNIDSAHTYFIYIYLYLANTGAIYKG